MDKFWERYIQSRPAPGESKGAFEAFAAAHRDPGPRNMAEGGRIGFLKGKGVKLDKANLKRLTDSTNELYDTYGKDVVDKAAKEWAEMSNKEKNRTRKIKIQNFNKIENATDRSNFKRKFLDDIEKYGEWNIDRKFDSRQKRVLREQGLQIKLIEATNKPGKFDAAKFAKNNNISMKELKNTARLLQNNMYDKAALITGTMSKESRAVLDWVPTEDIKRDATLSKLSKSGLTDYVDNRINAKFYDAFAREKIKGTNIKNPTQDLEKYRAIRKNKNEYESLRRLINKKYPSLNFQLDHPLSQRSINALMEGTAEELSRVNVLDQELNQSFKKHLSDKYLESLTSKNGKVNLEAKKAVEKIAKDLNINIGKISDKGKVITRGVSSFEKLNIKDEILKSLKNQQNLSTNFKAYVKNNPDVLKMAGFTDTSKLGTRLTKVTDKHMQGIEKLMESIGCPGLASGGRASFLDGTTCFKKGQALINSGMKGATKAQAINFAKLANNVYRGARWVTKWGIIPEMLFIGGETLVHMGMGATMDEGFKKSVSYIPGLGEYGR